MFYVILWRFAALPVSAQSLQLLAFITIQPGTDGTLAPTDKISLASLIQAVFLTAGYYTGNTWGGACKESYRFYKNVVSDSILFRILSKNTGKNNTIFCFLFLLVLSVLLLPLTLQLFTLLTHISFFPWFWLSPLHPFLSKTFIPHWYLIASPSFISFLSHLPEFSLDSESESEVSEDSEVFSGRLGSWAMSMGVSLYSGLLWGNTERCFVSVT